MEHLNTDENTDYIFYNYILNGVSVTMTFDVYWNKFFERVKKS